MKYAMFALAATALIAAGVHANPSNGKNGKSEAAHGPAAKGNGKDHGMSPGPVSPGNVKPPKSAKTAMNVDHGPQAKIEHGPPAKPAKAAKDKGPALPMLAKDSRSKGSPGKTGERFRVLADGRHIYENAGDRPVWGGYEPRGPIKGCPPGLAKKHNGCVPPGLAKAKEPRYRYTAFRPDWWGLGGRTLSGGRYLYSDGYLLRLDGDRVGGYIPLLGGALSIGNPWPSYYTAQRAPDYYVNYYDLGPSGGYRYADDVVYRVDPNTAAITSIAALLTGNDVRVGQPMPPAYDVYNVPYPYRSQYADGPDARYRYSDGYVYQIDPKTQLVAAAIELLAG